MAGQLPLFAPDVLPPSLWDLEGLLAGPAVIERAPGGAALVLELDDDRRAAALLDTLTAVGLPVDATAPGLRTVPDPRLLPLLDRWRADADAVTAPPPGFVPDAAQLRLWCLLGGRPVPGGHLLRVSEADEAAWAGLGAGLAAVGLAAVFLGQRGPGPGYRVMGSRKLRRLTELVGPPPPALPEDLWPSA